jgi:hypothetical protein
MSKIAVFRVDSAIRARDSGSARLTPNQLLGFLVNGLVLRRVSQQEMAGRACLIWAMAIYHAVGCAGRGQSQLYIVAILPHYKFFQALESEFVHHELRAKRRHQSK